MSVDLKKRSELGVVSSFIEAAKSHDLQLEIVEQRERPDFILRNVPCDEMIGAEVTTCYYDQNAARLLWREMRTSESDGTGTVVNPETALMESIENALSLKSGKEYLKPCLLLIHCDAPLTTADDFERQVLPALPQLAASGFHEIYLRMAAKTPSIDLVWWRIAPDKLRYYERPY